jgi:hypothetical protein
MTTPLVTDPNFAGIIALLEANDTFMEQVPQATDVLQALADVARITIQRDNNALNVINLYDILVLIVALWHLPHTQASGFDRQMNDAIQSAKSVIEQVRTALRQTEIATP